MIFRLFIIICFFFQLVNSQNNTTPVFGEPSAEELKMTSYPEDPNANAVILYESGDYSFETTNRQIRLIKRVYRKIKILTTEGKNQATVTIPLYKTKNTKENLTRLRAITHNQESKVYLLEENIFTRNVSEKWNEVVFTYPNVHPGSVLELEYTIETPFFFNLEGWEFQSNIPTVYSQFNAEIPGYYRYNRILKGSQKLDINEASIKQNCFYPVSDTRYVADCEILSYAMENIPAFEKEAYMLSENNYKSKIEFQLEEATLLNGTKEYYTKDWKAVDKEFKSNKNIGAQSRKNNFFKNQLPLEIVEIKNQLDRAKAIYSFIQNHFSWNGKYGIFQEANVKKAFDERSGSISEINLALINALQIANIDANIGLLSTRENGIPTKNYAVISDFNYLITHITIDGNEYFLDASDKFTPFGIVPFHCLNNDVRIMDFKKGSYWRVIKPEANNVSFVNIHLSVNENNILSGNIREIYSGYNALSKRKEIDNIGLENYLMEKASVFNLFEITSHNINNKDSLHIPIQEDFSIVFNTQLTQKNFLNPFLIKWFPNNPFRLENRIYPVDFGFPRKFTYILTLDLKDSFQIIDLPDNKLIKLIDDEIEVGIIFSKNNNILQIKFHINLNTHYFNPEDYIDLKDIFNSITDLQNNSLIIIEKK